MGSCDFYVSAPVRSEIEYYRLMTDEEKNTVLRCIGGYSDPSEDSKEKRVYRIGQQLMLCPDWRLSKRVLDPSLRLCLSNGPTHRMNMLNSRADVHVGYLSGRGMQVLQELIRINSDGI